MNDSQAAIGAACIAGIVSLCSSAWSCHASEAVQDKQTASDVLIATLQNKIESQRLVLEKQQGELNVQTFADNIKARQEEALKTFLPDVLSTDHLRKQSAVIVLTALYPNEASEFFQQALLVASTLDLPPNAYVVQDPSDPPASYYANNPGSAPANFPPFSTDPPTTIPTPIATTQQAPPIKYHPRLPLSALVNTADLIKNRTGRWTIRVSLDPTPETAAYEGALLTKDHHPFATFHTPQGIVTTTGIYDSETDASLALRAMGALSGRGAYVVRIASLCVNSSANALCTAP